MKLVPLSADELEPTRLALTESCGNISAAARAMGIPRTTVGDRKKALMRLGLLPATNVNAVAEEPKRFLKIMVIPDCQVKPGVNTDHLAAAGKYAALKHPDVIVCIGDFADMASLSSYDKGHKSFEGRTYKADIDAAKAGMKRFMSPLTAEQKLTLDWCPQLFFTLGNHEDRITRAIELERNLEGTISLSDLGYEKWGWEVYPFKETVTVAGIVFSHYLVSGTKGLPISTAASILTKRHQSAVVGHLQGRNVAYAVRADGSAMTAIIAGSFYSHDEHFMGPQGNKHWRGIVMLHEAHDGQFDEMFVSINYLLTRFGGSK